MIYYSINMNTYYTCLCVWRVRGCVCVRVQRREKPHPHIFPYIPHISLVFGSDMFRWWFQIHRTSLPNSWAMWPDKSIKQLSSDASQTIPDDTSDTSDTTWYHTLCRQSDLLERSRVETSRRSQVTVNSRSACRRSDLVGDHMVYYIILHYGIKAIGQGFHDLSRSFTCFRFSTTYSCYKMLQELVLQTDQLITLKLSLHFSSPSDTAESPSLPLAVSWCVSTLLGLACWPDWDLATWLPRCARS